MSSFQLKAEKREKLGSLEARRIKLAGKIPAVIYSKSGNINISLDKREFEQEYLKGGIQTRVAELDLAGKKLKVIAHIVELDPVSDKPIHVELLNCDETKVFKAQPKINFINQDKAPGLKKAVSCISFLEKLVLFAKKQKTSLLKSISMHRHCKWAAKLEAKAYNFLQAFHLKEKITS